VATGSGETSFAQELRTALRGLPERDMKIVFVGVLNRHLPKGQRAVLVGGALVELYTDGAYVTGDVDLIGDSGYIGPLLLSAGFRRSGRHYVEPKLGLAVEVAGRSLRHTETVQYVEFRGYDVPVVSVEDAVVDRLLGAKFWKSQTDWEQAILLFAAWRSRLNVEVLRDKARANEVDDFLRELEAIAIPRRSARRRT